MSIPTWLRDIESYTDAIPYGKVDVSIDRVNRRVVTITTIGAETLRYQDNNECVKDILSFITSLIDSEHTGIVDFSIDMKSGTISLLTIKNTKKTQY